MDLQLGRLRREKGLLQDDMARLLGIERCTYGTWERGEHSIALDRACDICDVLGCSLDALAGRETPSAGLSGDTGVLVGFYEECTPRMRQSLMDAARGMALSSRGERGSDTAVA